MAGLERLLVLLVAAILGAVGMVRCFWPQKQAGPVFLPAQTVSTAPEQEGALPVKVPGTQLRIQAMVQYEGPYWEDGTGAYVSNVAALMLYNASDSGIAYAQVTLQLEGKTYEFEFTYLPAGGRLLVPEKNGQPYTRGNVTDCRCGKLVTGQFGLDQLGIRLAQNGLAGVVLENTTSQDLENVCLYYKLHMDEENAYVGGTTYRQAVGKIPAGGTLEIVPEHFVWGYSAVVDIRVGEE